MKISWNVCSAPCLACVRRRHRWVLFNKSAFIDRSENRLWAWRITRHRSLIYIYIFIWSFQFLIWTQALFAVNVQVLLFSANADSTLPPSVSCYRPFCILVDMITSVPSTNFAVKQLQEVLSSIEMPQQIRIIRDKVQHFWINKAKHLIVSTETTSCMIWYWKPLQY